MISSDSKLTTFNNSLRHNHHNHNLKISGKRKAVTNNSKTVNGKEFHRKSQTAKRNLITGSSSSTSRRRLTFNDVVTTSDSHLNDENDNDDDDENDDIHHNIHDDDQDHDGDDENSLNAIDNDEENESFNNSSQDGHDEDMIGDQESSASSRKGNKTESLNTNAKLSIVGNITAPFSLRKQIELAVQLSIDGECIILFFFLFIHF